MPIIQKLIVAYKLWHEYLVRFDKTNRYAIGLRINNLFLDVIECVFAASHKNKETKELYLIKASDAFDLLKFLLQVVWELGFLDTKKYIALSEPLNEIGKMLGGWLRQTKTR